MVGVDDFVENVFGDENYTFRECLKLVVYGYLELVNEGQKHSIQEVSRQILELKGKLPDKLPLEDYLRNNLVNRYINPNKSKFDLSSFIFICGADELFENIQVGILDIKVCSSDLEEEVYYIFECKMLTEESSSYYKYIHEGALRFTSFRKYYAQEYTPIAGMISFIKHKDCNILSTKEVAKKLGSYLDKYSDRLALQGKFERYFLSSDEFRCVEMFEELYLSKHLKDKVNMPITIIHILLDYENVIIA